jgi:hypothetical protein
MNDIVRPENADRKIRIPNRRTFLQAFPLALAGGILGACATPTVLQSPTATPVPRCDFHNYVHPDTLGWILKPTLGISESIPGGKIPDLFMRAFPKGMQFGDWTATTENNVVILGKRTLTSSSLEVKAVKKGEVIPYRPGITETNVFAIIATNCTSYDFAQDKAKMAQADPLTYEHMNQIFKYTLDLEIPTPVAQ